MIKEPKFSRFAVVFNIFIYTLIASHICFSSLVMKKMGNSAWIAYLIYALFCFLFFIFYKPKNINIDKTSLFIKIMIFLYVILKVAIIIYFATTIISIWFYPKTDQYIFVFVFFLLISFLATRKDYIIISLGFMLGIGLILFFITALSMKTPHDLGLLLPLEIPNRNILKIFYLLMLPLDNIFYLFYQDSYQKPLNKWHLIIPTALAMIISSLTIIDAYTIVTYKYYQGLYMPSITRYFLHTGEQYFQHLDLILAYVTFTLAIYKSSFFLKAIKKIMCPSYRFKNILGYLGVILSFLITLLFIKNSTFPEPFMQFSSIIIIFLTIIVLYKKEREKQNA